MIGLQDFLSRRPRLLLLAYACSPDGGSEFRVGWNRARLAARCCETWVLCEGTLCEADVRQHMTEQGETAGLHFVFLPRKPWQRWLEQIPGAWYLSYNLWHRRAYRLARRLHAQVHFDLVHQVTFSGYREPGYLWNLPLPFVWGPLGGTQDYPWRFLPLAGARGAAKEWLRAMLNQLQLRLGRRIRRAAHHTAALLAANAAVAEDFRRVLGAETIRMLETGIEEVLAVPPSHGGRTGPFRILWVGRLEHRKALPLLIEALARLPAGRPFELRVIGSGPQETRWKRLAQRRGVGPHCRWLGWLSRETLLRQYTWADALVFTSLRDTSGNVVLEALSRGVPVICFDHQGVRDIVTHQCGIKIPVAAPRQAVVAFRDAIVRLQEDPAMLRRLRQGALARARDYLWSRQGAEMAELYHRVLARGGKGGLTHEMPSGTGTPASTLSSAAVAKPSGLNRSRESSRLTQVGNQGGDP